MKKTSRYLSFIIALVLVMSLTVSASAATVTINEKLAGHTFKAYQIFTGTESATAKQLSDIAWGNGINASDFITALKEDKTIGIEFTSVSYSSTDPAASAKDVAAVLATLIDTKANIVAQLAYKNKTDTLTALAEGSNTLASGYYLIVDATEFSTGTESTFFNAALLQVTSDINIGYKTALPTLQQQVKKGENWGDYNDVQIGDTVEFRTITTVPDTTYFEEYPTYVIHVEMDDGLTPNADTNVSVKVDDTTELDKEYYTPTVTGNNITVEIKVEEAIKDGVITKNSELYTYYTAELNEKADPSSKETSNAYLEYSNEPNDKDSKGNTPKDPCYIYTFKVTVKKVDESKNDLSGAQFVLTEKANLKLADLTVTGGVPTVTSDLIALVKDTSGNYAVASDAQLKDNTVTKSYVIDAGTADIKGLDDATEYYLLEIKAPGGYNMLKEAVKFMITATYDTDDHSTVPEITISEEKTTTTIVIENQAGSILPTTGGIGTTIFYIIGGILFSCAFVALITKKRMN